MDSDEEYENLPSWRGVPGTIILINIFENEVYDTFASALVATCRVIKRHLRLSSSQYIGVCVFGTEDKNASLLDSKSLVELLPLALPTVDDYKKLKNTPVSSFVEAKRFIFSEVLWHCSKMFTNFKKQLSLKTIIILTPLHISPVDTDKTPTLKRVEDLVDTNIELRVINMSPDDSSVDKFYEKFFAKANKGNDFVIPKSMKDPLEMAQKMDQESHRNLAVSKLNFQIGKNVEIGVGLYKLVKSSNNYHKKTNLYSETNSVVTSLTKTIKVNTDSESKDIENNQNVPLLKSEILHFIEYGGERVEFTETEKKVLNNPFSPQILKLLGFKPSYLFHQAKLFLESGYFLFPNEEVIEGSTIAFKALHKACTDLSVVAICVLCPRSNTKPSHVALCPCTRPLNLDVEIGFDVIKIPYVESIRDLSFNECTEEHDVDKRKRALMNQIINETQFNYEIDMFENPKLQSEYKAIEAIVLKDDDDIDSFVDTTKPDTKNFKNIKDDLFEELFGPFGALSLKRESAVPSSSGSKRSKSEIDQDLLVSRINDGAVAKYTVAQLKDILHSKDIKDLPYLTGLKKDKLVELVYKYFTT